MDESCGNRSIFSDWRNDPDCFTLWASIPFVPISTGWSLAGILSFRDAQIVSTYIKTSKERRDDLFAVSIWCVMICVALVTNVLILVGIGSSATMRSATCYWLVISLAFCDIGMVTIGIVHLVPATTFRTRFVETFGWRNIIMLFFYDVFYYTGVLLLGFMASNRFVSIVYPMEYTRIFSRGRSLAYIIFVFKYVDLSVNSLTLLLMIVSYMVIIFKVRQSGRAMTNNQLTIRTRFFIVSIAFLMLFSSWQWLPYVSQSKWAYFIMTSLYYIYNSVNPIVFLLFNTQLRRELHSLLCRQRGISESQ